MKRVAVFGMGYVGCVTAACMARDGCSVVGVDVNETKIETLRSGRPTVLEPGLDVLVADAERSGFLRATCDAHFAVANSDVAIVAVGTPAARDGSVSIDAVERVVQSIGQALRDGDREYTVCIRSTILPDAIEERLIPLLQRSSGRELGAGWRLCNNPEFLREGSAIRDYDEPPFLLVGASERRIAEQILALYPNVNAKAIITDLRTAGLVKYACNAFHALKISFANEIGAVAASLGADGHEIMRIVCEDRKLNVSSAYLKPGLPFGGSCLPKDVKALVRYGNRAAVDLALLPAVLAANDRQLGRAIDLVQEAGVRRIGVVGLGFKAGTDDLRSSPAVTLCETLIGRGYEVRVYDPFVSVSRLHGANLSFVDEHLPHLANLLVETPEELFSQAGALVLTSDVADGIDWANGFAGEVIDLRRALATPARSYALV